LIYYGFDSGCGVMKKYRRYLIWYMLFCWTVGMFMVAVHPVSASPATIYVSTTGSDSTGNGLIGTPYKSLRKALNVSTTNNNDIIIMRGGTYTWSIATTGILINRSKITIQAYTGETPIIDGSSVTLSGTGASLVRFSSTGGTCYNNITLNGIHFANSNQYACYGIALVNYNANITIKNCDFSEIAKNAVYFYSDEQPLKWIWDVNINNCTFNDIYTAVGSGECISLLGCRDFVFENNTIGNSTKQLFNCGSSWYGRVCHNVFRNEDYYAMKLDPNNHAETGYKPTGSHINIFCNQFVGEGYGMLMLSPEVTNDRLDNISIYNNLIYATAVSTTNYGICLNGHTSYSSGQTFDNITIKFNTIYIKDGSSSYALYSIKRSATFTNIVVVNNIFVTVNNDQVIFSDVNKGVLTVSHNCFWKVGGTALGVHYADDSDDIETNSISGDPGFQDRASDNYNLSETSICLDQGSSSYTTSDDFDGTTRPQNLLYDIGAYELGVESEPPEIPDVDPFIPPLPPSSYEHYGWVELLTQLFADLSAPLSLIAIFAFLVIFIYLKVS